MAVVSNMAADGINKLELNVLHGQDKYKLSMELPETQSGSVLTLGHLVAEVEKSIGVKASGQKLIFKGKSLNDRFASLKKLGLKSGSKIMLLGKKSDPEADENMKSIAKVEDQSNKSENKLSEIIQEVDGIQKGYLANDLQMEALSTLSKQVACLAEELTRQLEQLDSLILGEASEEVKYKRKAVVKKIQALLDRCDNMSSEVKDLQDRS